MSQLFFHEVTHYFLSKNILRTVIITNFTIRFYNQHSSFVHGGLDSNRECTPAIGQKQIHQKIQQLNFRDCHAKISQVDSQLTLENGVVVQVNYINFK